MEVKARSETEVRETRKQGNTVQADTSSSQWRRYGGSPFGATFVPRQMNSERQKQAAEQSERSTVAITSRCSRKKGTAIRRRTCQFSLQTKAKRFAPPGVWAQIASAAPPTLHKPYPCLDSLSHFP